MDLNELVKISTAEAYSRGFLKDLTDAFARFSKPLIASVEGFAVSFDNILGLEQITDMWLLVSSVVGLRLHSQYVFSGNPLTFVE